MKPVLQHNLSTISIFNNNNATKAQKLLLPFQKYE